MKPYILLAVISISFCLYSQNLRIVSLSPAITEIICKLEGEKYLVGRSSVCDHPAVSTLPIVGRLGFPFAEAIFALQATHVITDITHPQANWEILRTNDIEVKIFSTEKINHYPRIVKAIGNLLKKEKSAEKEIIRFNNELQVIKSSRPAQPVKVLILLGLHPLVSCQKGSFLDEVVSLAGGINCGSNSGFNNPYFTVTPEFIFQVNPEVILLLTDEPQAIDFFKQAPWNSLQAVKKNNIISSIPMSTICRLTPKITNAVKQLQCELIKCKEVISKGMEI